MFAFGGAGPLHAVELASELGIPKVLIPARPGITNALGCMVADLRHDYVRTINTPLPALRADVVHDALAQQEADGRAMLARENVDIEAVRIIRSADMQFQGQSHLLNIPLESAEPTLQSLHELFEQAYWDRFEVALPEIRPVLVNLHTAVLGRRPRVDLASLSQAHSVGQNVQARNVWFMGGEMQVPILRREHLTPGQSLTGPAIIEQLDTTTVLPPNCAAVVDVSGNLIVSVEAA